MRFLISATLVCWLAVTAESQQPAKESKESPKSATKLVDLPLEDLLAQALKNNPDIRSAEAKVREAEAELNRTRLAVMQKVTQASHDLAVRMLIVADAKNKFRRGQALQESRAISTEEVALAKLNLDKAEADVAQLEAQLPYLVGKALLGLKLTSEAPRVWDATAGGVQFWDLSKAMKAYADLEASRQPAGTMADKVRKLLDTPITGEWRQTPVHDIVNFFGKKFQDQQINFFNNVTVAVKPPVKAPLVTMEITNPIPMGAALRFLEDLSGLRFIMREYGIVLVPPDSLPPGAVSVIDFWKNRPIGQSQTGIQR